MENNSNPNINPTNKINAMPQNNIPTPQPVQKPSSGIGAIIATTVIIILIIVGGLYFWGKRIETQKATQALLESVPSSDDTASLMEAEKIEKVSNDDNLDTLLNEIGSTDTNLTE